MYKNAKSISWPSGLHKPIMQINLDATAVAKMTGLEFDRVLGDMGYEQLAGCEIEDFGPVLFQSGEDDPFRNVNIHVDYRYSTKAAIEIISSEFNIPPDLVLWRREEDD